MSPGPDLAWLGRADRSDQCGLSGFQPADHLLCRRGEHRAGFGPSPVSLGGNFIFNVAAQSGVALEVGATNLNFDLTVGTTNPLKVLSFTQTASGAAAFAILDDGAIAGTAPLSFQTGLVGISGTMTLAVDTLASTDYPSSGPSAGTFTATVSTPNGQVNLNFSNTPTPPIFQVQVSNGNIHLGSIAFPVPNFSVVINTGPSVANPPEIDLDQGTTQLVTVDSSGNIQTPGLASVSTAVSTLLSNLYSNLDNPDPAQLAGMLQQLISWLTSAASSSILKTQIPFTGGTTIGQVLNWGQVLIGQLYSPMVTSELQSSSVQEAITARTTNASGALMLTVGSTTDSVQLPGVSYDSSISDSDTNSLLYQLNMAINKTSLKGAVVAQWDSSGYLELAPVQSGTTVSLSGTDNTGLGFTVQNGELRSTVQEAITAGSVSNATLQLQLGTNGSTQTQTAAVTINGLTYSGSILSDAGSLLQQLNTDIGNVKLSDGTPLSNDVVAQFDANGFLSIALTSTARSRIR